jgi:hypothetical protein
LLTFGANHCDPAAGVNTSGTSGTDDLPTTLMNESVVVATEQNRIA